MSNEMENNEIYPLVIHHFPESIRQIHKGDARTSSEDTQECVDELKKMLKVSKSTRDIEFEEDFLILYLKANSNNVDAAFSKIRNLITLRKDHGYFFRSVDFDFTSNPASSFITILPHRRKDGSVTVLCELGKWNPEEVPFETLKQMAFIIYMQELRNPVTQASGFNVIYDFANVGMRYLRYCTPQNMYLLNYISFEVFPAKYAGYHLINGNFITNLLVRLSKPFLPHFIQNILHIHSSAEELLDFFPPSMLPVQYGGSLTYYYMDDWLKKANAQHGNFPPSGQKNIF